MLLNTFLVRNNCIGQPYNHKVLQSSNLGCMHRHKCETITHLSGLLDWWYMQKQERLVFMNYKSPKIVTYFFYCVQ